LHRYAFGTFELVGEYSAWVERNSVSQRDFFVPGILPLILVGIGIYMLPVWLGKLIAFVLIVPYLYIGYALMRCWLNRQINTDRQ
jgi:hypothetical protein